ncbi:RAD51-associated protein 1 isoform X2 [Apus apus]|uniref:RAD51-associated protein 1 isoform X2 n=1 Tax=Apus apus TaxID=8895 RepID=UPI0021F91DB1|nr:RAD51-associated protein 1 isoform X2 [Apus apus]
MAWPARRCGRRCGRPCVGRCGRRCEQGAGAGARRFGNKKTVDYSQFGDLGDDDEDFAYIAAPSSKKSRTQLKDPKKEKKEKQKKPLELSSSQKQTPTKRISLDDKLYQRGLEVALALSLKEKSANILEVQNSEEQGLNQVMDGDEFKAYCSQRTAASKVPAHQKFLTVDSDDGEHATDSEPESVPSEESEDSNYSEGDDEDFAMEKKKAKGNKKKTKQKMPSEREKKNPKSEINTTVSPVVSPSWIMEQKSEPTQKIMSDSSEPVGRPLHTSSPVTVKRPKWIPPAASGSSNNSMKYGSVKSPTQCLRLGLSRLARVKPLHPSATSS